MVSNKICLIFKAGRFLGLLFIFPRLSTAYAFIRSLQKLPHTILILKNGMR